VLLKVLTLTGQRRNTVAAMRWCDIDLEAATWLIPRELMKNDTAHLVDLGPTAVEILRAQPRDHELVFPGRDGRQLNGWGRPKVSTDKAADALAAEEGLPPLAHWTLHDLRRTCASKLAEIGFEPAVIERYLAHLSGVQGGLTGVYQRFTYAEQRRQAALAWDAHIRAVAGLDQPT
jgi:integrase